MMRRMRRMRRKRNATKMTNEKMMVRKRRLRSNLKKGVDEPKIRQVQMPWQALF